MYIAASEDDACYCDERVCEETGRHANRGWKCSVCRKHEGHQHCDQCHACMGNEDGLCADCASERCGHECDCDTVAIHEAAAAESMREFLRDPGAALAHFSAEDVARAKQGMRKAVAK